MTQQITSFLLFPLHSFVMIEKKLSVIYCWLISLVCANEYVLNYIILLIQNTSTISVVGF